MHWYQRSCIFVLSSRCFSPVIPVLSCLPACSCAHDRLVATGRSLTESQTPGPGGPPCRLAHLTHVTQPDFFDRLNAFHDVSRRVTTRHWTLRLPRPRIPLPPAGPLTSTQTHTHTCLRSSACFSFSAFFAAFSMFSFLSSAAKFKPNGSRRAQRATYNLGSDGLIIRFTAANFLVCFAFP